MGPNVHYRVHKGFPLVSNLNQMNYVQITQFHLRLILILSYHLHLGLLSSVFTSWFPIKILYTCFFLWTLHILCTSSLSLDNSKEACSKNFEPHVSSPRHWLLTIRHFYKTFIGRILKALARISRRHNCIPNRPSCYSCICYFVSQIPQQ
jgi:magnesium-transporting ATPase (P-type)